MDITIRFVRMFLSKMRQAKNLVEEGPLKDDLCQHILFFSQKTMAFFVLLKPSVILDKDHLWNIHCINFNTA